MLLQRAYVVGLSCLAGCSEICCLARCHVASVLSKVVVVVCLLHGLLGGCSLNVLLDRLRFGTVGSLCAGATTDCLPQALRDDQSEGDWKVVQQHSYYT
jgi:hypothetical protein